MTVQIDTENAGLERLAPLIRQLLGCPGFVSNSNFNDRQSAQKAVSLRQYAIDGQALVQVESWR